MKDGEYGAGYLDGAAKQRKIAEKLETELVRVKELLRLALKEIDKHNRDYHHVTSPEQIEQMRSALETDTEVEGG